MKKHDFGAWFLLCGLLFLFTPGVSAMAEETEPLFAFAAQAEEVHPGGSFARDLHAGARGHRRVRAVCGF